MNRTRNQGRRSLVVVAGSCALLLYALTSSPLGLAAAVLVGSLDPAHQVNLGAGDHGTQLILRHGGNCAVHRHGPIARALVIFARRASATNPDHVLQFCASDNRLQPLQLVAPRPAIFEQPDFAPLESVLCHACEARFPRVPMRHPPDEQERRLCLRSTVLLI